MSHTEKYWVWITSTILFAVNFIVKGIFLSSNSLGGDEPFSVYHAQMDILSIIKFLSEGNNPPLYEIILHYWIKFWGVSELSVRFPSLVFSSFTVIFIYKIGAKYLNNRVALYSSILFICSNYQILFAQQARVYSLLGLLSAMSMHYFLALLNQPVIEKSEKKYLNKYVINIIIINTLIIYSHYFGFFILITQFLIVVSNKKLRTNHCRTFVLALAIIALLYTPNVYIILNRFLVSSIHGTWVKPPNGIDSVYNMFRSLSNAPVVTISALLILTTSLIKLKITKEMSSINTRVIVFWFLFIFFFMFGISYFIPMFSERYIMPAAIAFYLTLGISLDYLIEIKKYKYIIPSVVIVLFASTTEPNISNKRNVRETVDKIKTLKDEETLVIICPANFILNFTYYYDLKVFKEQRINYNYSNIHHSMRNKNIYAINNIQDLDFKKWKHIIYLDAGANFTKPNNGIVEALELNYTVKSTYNFYEIFNVSEYY